MSQESHIPPPSPLRSSGPLPGARAALALLLLINLFNYIDRYVLAAVVPDIEKTFFSSPERVGAALTAFLVKFQHLFHFNPTLALEGLLSTAFMVMYMIAAPIFGRLAERRSRWVLVGVGVALWSLASGASGLASTFVVLLATRCFVGIGEAAYGPVAPAMISDYYPVRIRGQVLSWFYMAIPVGTALGYVLGEQVARSGLGTLMGPVLGFSSESWRWAFYLVTPPGLLLGIWCFFMREPPVGQADLPTPQPARQVRWKDYRVLLQTPSYVLCTLGMAAMTFAMGGMGFWMPYYLKHRPGVHGSPATVFGVILVVTGLLATLLGGLAGDKLRSRYPGSYFMVSGLAMLIGFPLAMAVISAPVPWIWLYLALTCFCLFFNTGPTNTILANVTHPAMRAAAFALNIFFIHAFGDVISPFIIGLISDKYDMDVAFRVVAVMCLLSGLLWIWGTRYLAKDTALASLRMSSL
jgi:MFS family permease